MATGHHVQGVYLSWHCGSRANHRFLYTPRNGSPSYPAGVAQYSPKAMSEALLTEQSGWWRSSRDGEPCKLSDEKCQMVGRYCRSLGQGWFRGCDSCVDTGVIRIFIQFRINSIIGGHGCKLYQCQCGKVTKWRLSILILRQTLSMHDCAKQKMLTNTPTIQYQDYLFASKNASYGWVCVWLTFLWSAQPSTYLNTSQVGALRRWQQYLWKR